ncbi:MAG: FadR/GntR family transcriptional regulator [Negativicutes bacterium]|nr:FadR/GntR family transcriptional regulator [Negativicutes bacterium]
MEHLTRMIRDGQLPPGEKLQGERDLAKKFGTGRQCLREALSALEIMGVIEIKVGKGSYVRNDAIESLNKYEPQQSFTEADSPFDLLEARKIVEGKTAALAAQRATEEDIAEMEKLLRIIEQNRLEGIYAPEYGRDFHRMAAKAGRNPVLYQMVCDVMDRMDKLLWHKLKRGVTADHLPLLNAIKKGDSRRAEKAMLKHLADIEVDLLDNGY